MTLSLAERVAAKLHRTVLEYFPVCESYESTICQAIYAAVLDEVDTLRTDLLELKRDNYLGTQAWVDAQSVRDVLKTVDLTDEDFVDEEVVWLQSEIDAQVTYLRAKDDPKPAPTTVVRLLRSLEKPK